MNINQDLSITNLSILFMVSSYFLFPLSSLSYFPVSSVFSDLRPPSPVLCPPSPALRPPPAGTLHQALPRNRTPPGPRNGHISLQFVTNHSTAHTNQSVRPPLAFSLIFGMPPVPQQQTASRILPFKVGRDISYV